MPWVWTCCQGLTTHACPDPDRQGMQNTLSRLDEPEPSSPQLHRLEIAVSDMVSSRSTCLNLLVVLLFCPVSTRGTVCLRALPAAQLGAFSCGGLAAAVTAGSTSGHSSPSGLESVRRSPAYLRNDPSRDRSTEPSPPRSFATPTATAQRLGCDQARSTSLDVHTPGQESIVVHVQGRGYLYGWLRFLFADVWWYGYPYFFLPGGQVRKLSRSLGWSTCDSTI